MMDNLTKYASMQSGIASQTITQIAFLLTWQFNF